MKFKCVKDIDSTYSEGFKAGEVYEGQLSRTGFSYIIKGTDEKLHWFTTEPDHKGNSFETWFTIEEAEPVVQPELMWVAVHKKTGKLVTGYRGQLSMRDKNNFAKSIGQTGLKRTEYDFKQIDVKGLI